MRELKFSFFCLQVFAYPSHPTRVRELKYYRQDPEGGCPKSHPVRVRELKYQRTVHQGTKRRSPPHGVRELKYLIGQEKRVIRRRPRVGCANYNQNGSLDMAGGL